jgi:uncharacterized protein (DUF488 family)
MARQGTVQSRLGAVDADFFTVGYERTSLEQLFLLLKGAGVRCLVDVRDAPWSRVPEYRKDVLEDRLAGLGREYGYQIRYVSMPAVGNPPENRRSDRSTEAMMACYRDYMLAKPAALDGLAGLLGKCRSALMCYEADPRECHRSVLAAILAERYGLSYADLR